ncbi:MAG: hypothetical protein R2789_05620 [Microthrixaceae bacterium]
MARSLAALAEPLRVDDLTLKRMKELFADFPGEAEVHILLDEKVLRLPDEFLVDTETGLVGELRVLLGSGRGSEVSCAPRSAHWDPELRFGAPATELEWTISRRRGATWRLT